MTDLRTTIRHVEPLAGRRLRITFADRAVHELDVGPLLASGGALAAVRDDRAVFEAVRVNAEFGTVEWPGGIDLDPDVLRGDQLPASGVRLPRRVVEPT